MFPFSLDIFHCHLWVFVQIWKTVFEQLTLIKADFRQVFIYPLQKLFKSVIRDKGGYNAQYPVPLRINRLQLDVLVKICDSLLQSRLEGRYLIA